MLIHSVGKFDGKWMISLFIYSKELNQLYPTLLFLSDLEEWEVGQIFGGN